MVAATLGLGLAQVRHTVQFVGDNDRHMMRAFTFYFAGLAALLVLVARGG